MYGAEMGFSSHQNVVKLVYPEPAIAHVIMEERQFKNTFSPALIQGLIKVFDEIHDRSDIKVVIIQGYENYFCCGGTKEELLSIYEGKITFADLSFYRLLLDCDVITIAAMQGHALGGGLAFGCYADFLFLAEECIYSTNFMKYGFTPGMGATYIIPKKMGESLGHKMLYSARNYFGSELKQHNTLVNVVKKQEVITSAFNLAKEFIDKPLTSLKLLKDHLTSKIKIALKEVIEKELLMHEVTFKQPEVKEKIELLFGC